MAFQTSGSGRVSLLERQSQLEVERLSISAMHPNFWSKKAISILKL